MPPVHRRRQLFCVRIELLRPWSLELRPERPAPL